jgi:hypothetical protein
MYQQHEHEEQALTGGILILLFVKSGFDISWLFLSGWSSCSAEITERLPSLACFFLLLCFVLSCRLEPMDFHLRDPFPMLASSTRTFDELLLSTTPLAPAGSTRVSVHVKPSACSTWFHMLSTDILALPLTATVKLLSLYLRHLTRTNLAHRVAPNSRRRAHRVLHRPCNHRRTRPRCSSSILRLFLLIYATSDSQL